MVGVAPAYVPAEDPLVEGSRLMDVDRGHVQVGEAPRPGQASLHARGVGRLCLLVVVLVHCWLLSHVHLAYHNWEVSPLKFQKFTVPTGALLIDTDTGGFPCRSV